MMFRNYRHRSDRHVDKFDFRFSKFNASQIPKGWDRLMVSLVSIETGKTFAKSSKAVVRNGSCQWTDAFKETISIAQDDASKETEEGHLKIIVSTVSPGSRVLGEAILNLASYVNTQDAATVTLPLKRCAYGTILQLQVLGIAAKTGFRDGLRKHLREFRHHNENHTIDHDDLDINFDESDKIYPKSLGSSSGNQLGGGTYNEEHGNKEQHPSVSGSHRSSDSGDSSVVRTNVSPKNSTTYGAYNEIGRQDSTGSHNSAGNGVGFGAEICKPKIDPSKELLEAAQETIEELRGEARMWEKIARKLKNDLEASRREYPASGSHRSSDSGDSFVVRPNLSPKNSTTSGAYNRQDSMASHNSAGNEVGFGDEIFKSKFDSSKEFLEAAQETIEELRGEARMWEKIANKLKKDLEISRREFSDQADCLGELNKELSAAYSERDRLRAELEQLKLSVELAAKPVTSDSSASREVDIIYKLKELEEEVKFQKESNAMLTHQLNKSQESNYELLSILEELEETVEKQRAEIASYSLQTPKSDIHVGSCDSSMDVETKEVCHLTAKENTSLHSQLRSSEMEPRSADVDLVQEVEVLKIKVGELERDCAELTEENIELLYKLKEFAKGTEKHSQSNSFQCSISHGDGLLQQVHDIEKYQTSEQAASNDVLAWMSEVDDTMNFRQMLVLLTEIYKELQRPISHVKDPWFEDDPYVVPAGGTSIDISCASLREKGESILHSVDELDKLLGQKIAHCKLLFRYESKNIGDQNDMLNVSSTNNMELKINSNLQNISPESIEDNSFYPTSDSALHKEIAALKLNNGKLEDLIGQLNNQKVKLEEDLEIALREHSFSSKTLDDVQEQLLQLSRSMESQVAANKTLERKLSETESGKRELEINVSELEQENVHLSEHISGLEAQLRNMIDEKESNRLEFENSKSHYGNLKNEICQLEAELEAQKSELKQKLQETHKRLLEAEEESEFLKSSHSALEATIENLIDESSSLQRLNGDLRRQKLELHDKCTLLEVELSKSHEKSSEFMEQLHSLESKLVSLQDDTTTREKSIISQLEVLSKKNKENDEKLMKTHILLKTIDAERMAEVDNLQREVALLTSQISATDKERESIGSDALYELSTLRSNKIKLEYNLQDLLAKVQSYETDSCNARTESEKRVQDMIGLLNASKQSEEMLMADNQKLMVDIRCQEENAKRAADELELKLKTSENEIEQMKEDISSLKLQLQRIPQLQDEILSFKNSLDAVKFEKAKVEESLKLLSVEFGEVKAEKNQYMEKMAVMQKVLSDSEDSKLSNVALEEKLLRLEGDLTAREALFGHDTELKNELSCMKRTNSEYKRKIQFLEEEKDELVRKVQEHVEASKSRKEDKRLLGQEESIQKVIEGKPDASGMVDLEAKIKKLERELKEALHKNSLCQEELQNFQAGHPPKASISSETAPIKGSNDDKLSSLEAELKEMSERYSEMSLKYAEVEAERQELVLLLKSSKGQKRWF